MSFIDKKQEICEITKIKEKVLEPIWVQGLFCLENRTVPIFIIIVIFYINMSLY